jgi:hypothetical protein
VGEVLLDAETGWYCPNCPQTAVTRNTGPHTRFHACGGLHGLTAPLVPVGTRVRIRAVERADYEGDDAGNLTLGDDGRPYMSVVTEYLDGRNDCIAFAPIATLEIKND